MPTIDRRRFVRVVMILGALVFVALLTALVMLPDRLARIVELFTGSAL
jgi:hypothetical protein